MNNKTENYGKDSIECSPYVENLHYVSFSTYNGFVLNSKSKDLVLNTILFFNDLYYELHACVVLNTQIHLVIKPTAPILRIVKDIRTQTHHQINNLVKEVDELWLGEFQDNLIQSENEVFEKMLLIIYHPVKSGLVNRGGFYSWLYIKDWAAANENQIIPEFNDLVEEEVQLLKCI